MLIKMKKYILLLSLLFLSFSNSYCQTITLNKGENLRDFEPLKKQILDTCLLSIQYREMYVPDTLNFQKKKEYYMLLQIGKHLSRFSDFFILKSDSILNKLMEEKKSTPEIINQLMPYRKGKSSINIYKNYPVGSLTIIDRIPLSGNYKFSEEMTKPNWTFEKRDTIILGYKCKEATSTFRGRNYTAWYTEEIPISDGPWKFWGLPGLILKIYDTKSEYCFEASKIEKPNVTVEIYFIKKDYYNTTKKTFDKQLRSFYDNPGVALENSGVKIVNDELSKQIKSRPYNPIELSE